MGFVGTSNIVDVDDVDAFNLIELAEARRKATFLFDFSGTNASIDTEDATNAIQATAIIVNLILLISLKVP